MTFCTVKSSTALIRRKGQRTMLCPLALAAYEISSAAEFRLVERSAVLLRVLRRRDLFHVLCAVLFFKGNTCRISHSSSQKCRQCGYAEMRADVYTGHAAQQREDQGEVACGTFALPAVPALLCELPPPTLRRSTYQRFRDLKDTLQKQSFCRVSYVQSV